MAVDINAFNDIGNVGGRLMLADNTDGLPMIISAKEGFKEKVLSMLSHIPLLRNTQAVKEYTNKLIVDNQQVVGVFLHALANRFGYEVALNASENIDLSGNTKLKSKMIKQVTSQAEELQAIVNARRAERIALEGASVVEVDETVRRDNSFKSGDDGVDTEQVSDESQSEIISCQSRLEQQFTSLFKGVKTLQNLAPLTALTLPKTQSWLASWIYAEQGSVQDLQAEVRSFNQLLSEAELGSQFNTLSSLECIKLEPLLVKERVEQLDMDLELLSQGLRSIKNSTLAITPTDKIAVAPLLQLLEKQLVVCEGLISASESLKQFLSDTNYLRQDIVSFNKLLPDTLKGKLDIPQLLSCYRMFAPFIHGTGNLNSETYSPRLSLIETQPYSVMASHLAAVLSQLGGKYSSETLPDVKMLVQLVGHFGEKVLNLSKNTDEKSTTHQALNDIEKVQMFVETVLNKAKNLHDTQVEQLKKEIKLESKLSDMRQYAASLTQLLGGTIQAEPEKADDEDAAYASLLYMGGKEAVIKADKLVFDLPVSANDLNLAAGIEDELGHVLQPEHSELAKKVLGAQHQLAWHRGDNSASHSPNNQQNIQLDRDIEQLKLASEINEDKAGYLSFFRERQQMCNTYSQVLEKLVSTLPQGKVSLQFDQQLTEIKLERDSNLALLLAIEKLQEVEDELVIVGNQNKRLSVMSQELKLYQQAIKAERAEVNLQEYLSFLPGLKANNVEVRKLTEQKNLLDERVIMHESYLNDLYRGTLPQKLAEPQLSSPGLRGYLNYKRQLSQVQSNLNALDDAYQEQLLQLKSVTLEAYSHGGYPDQDRANSTEAWQSWLVQKFVGHWSAQYRPSIEELILERQLAKNNMSSMGEAYLALVKTVNESKSSLNPISAAMSLASSKGMVKALGDLHNWSIIHPFEARELAGNLTQTYNIITANPASFGQELVSTVQTLWQTGTVQNQIHDILNGTREEIPDKGTFSMTPEMIALLHLAQMAPYVAGGVKGAVNSEGGGPVLARVLTTMFSSAGIAAPVVGLAGGLLQTWSERQIANNMRAYRSTEVMVNALIKGMQVDGGLAARGQAVAGYMVQRQALQEVGTLARDCFEVGKMGAIKRFMSDAINWWKHATPAAKIFAVTTSLVSMVVISASAVGLGLLIFGTGGLGVAAAVGLGIGGAVIGQLLAKSMRLILLDSNFLGMSDAARKTEQEITNKRVEQALGRLGCSRFGKEIDGLSTFGGLLTLDESKAEQSALAESITAKLVDIAPQKQAEAFSKLLTHYAEQKGMIIEQKFGLHTELVIENAQRQLSGLAISDEALKECMLQIDAALELKV